MHSIIIIIPYFGQLPPMFKFWRQSALNNPTIDFLLITDSDIETSGNVKVRHCTFEECKNRIQLLFDFPRLLTSSIQTMRLQTCISQCFHR